MSTKEEESQTGDNKTKSEIDSLNTRLKNLNEENEELLNRLNKAKRKKERRTREFEDEKKYLCRKIDELEATKLELLEKVSRLSGEGIRLKDQQERNVGELMEYVAEMERKLRDGEERERNFKQQLEILKRNLKDKENIKKEMEAQKEKARQLKELAEALGLENAKIKEDLGEHARLLDLARRENNALRQHSNESSELEKDFQFQKQMIISVLEGETQKASKAAAETEVVKETARANEDTLREEIRCLSEHLQEKERILESEIMEKWKLQMEKEEQCKKFMEKEIELRSQIEELSNAIRDNRRINDNLASARNAELKAENDRMMAFLRTKEKRHDESVIEKDVEHSMQLKRLEEEWKARVEELEEKLHQDKAMHGDQLSTALNNNKKLAEELGRKTQECSLLDEKLVKCRAELEQSLRKVATLNDEDKMGKMERALVRLKLENDQARASNSENGSKDLLREKESHIVDLQREVSALRETLKKFQTEAALESRRQAADDRVSREKYDEILFAHRKLLEETTRLRATLEAGSHDPAVLVELFEARKNLNASTARIAQFEKWLDEIYNTGPAVGALGPRGSKVTDIDKTITLPELKTQNRVVNRLSKPKWKTPGKLDKRNI